MLGYSVEDCFTMLQLLERTSALELLENPIDMTKRNSVAKENRAKYSNTLMAPSLIPAACMIKLMTPQ